MGPGGQAQVLRQGPIPAPSEAWRPLPSEASPAEEELRREHPGGCTPSPCVPNTDEYQLMSHKGTAVAIESRRAALQLPSPCHCPEQPVAAVVSHTLAPGAAERGRGTEPWRRRDTSLYINMMGNKGEPQDGQVRSMPRVFTQGSEPGNKDGPRCTVMTPLTRERPSLRAP